MEGSIIPKVKICCISSISEAYMAIANGAYALGLVGNMPSGPGVIGDKLIREITRIIPPGISSFLLTSETDAESIIDHHRKVSTDTIQIVDDIGNENYLRIREVLPDVNLVQVIHVAGEESIEKAIEKSKYVDSILLDSGNPNLKVKELGGTGRVHNWDYSKIIRDEIEVPLFLAGGLNKNNIRQAISHVQPFGIDLCSGVREKGSLDEKKLKEFFSIINNVDPHL